MKNIAILLPAMRTGGAEKIFLNFLKTLPNEYKVTVILNRMEGELLDELPSTVTLIEDRLSTFQEIVKQDIKSLKIFHLLKDFLYYIRVKIGKRKEKNYRYLIKRTPAILGIYDCAIAYVGNVSTQIFSLMDRIKARKKIAWIHGETTELFDTKLFEECYRSLDKIYCVSHMTKKHFLDRFPSCRKKTEVYYNPIDKERILQKAEEICAENTLQKEYFNIVTVGRLSPEKGCDMIAEIAEIVYTQCKNIRWYIIGDGTEKERIQHAVKEKELEEVVLCIGNQNNPYPYMAQCDVYVQPSYEEGYSTTICEAGILGKAIIGTTTSGGIREQLIHEETGLIVSPTVTDIASAILRVYNSLELQKRLAENVQLHDFNHEKEIEKIILLLNT